MISNFKQYNSLVLQIEKTQMFFNLKLNMKKNLARLFHFLKFFFQKNNMFDKLLYYLCNLNFTCVDLNLPESHNVSYNDR